MLGECLSVLQVRQLAICFGLIVIISGYLSKDGFAISNMLFFLPVIFACQLDLLPYRGILLPASRGDRFYATVISGSTVTLLTTLAIAVIALISILLGPVLPDINLKGHTFGYHAMNVKYCFVTLPLMPIGFAVATLIPRRQVLKMIFSIVLMEAYLGFYVVTMIREIQFNLFIPPVLMMISWGISLLVLRYVCMRRCLAGAGSRGA